MRKEALSPEDIVTSGLCIGCGSCVAQSRISGGDAEMQFDAYGQLKPHDKNQWFALPPVIFSQTCPFSPSAKNEDDLAEELIDAENKDAGLGKFITSLAGYVSEGDYRIQGSSGGMTTWIATELMRTGMIDGVAHVVQVSEPATEGRFFRYRISHNLLEIRGGAKSRYYPVEMSDVLKTIGEVPGKYAIVAVPCMIKAVQLLRSKYPLYHERIVFTLGLFCGHMKSSRFVESFAWQMNVPVSDVRQVEFRQKHPDRPASWYNAMLHLRDGSSVNRDWWHLVDGDWGAGFFMNSACNYCDDVVAETADISFGDAWVEPYSSDWKGTNVIIVRSLVLTELINAGINAGRLDLREVTADLVTRTQAAGFRQRREGLAYRLNWPFKGVSPVKRIDPDSDIPGHRKRIYRMRFMISRWSHRIFRFARKINFPLLYTGWARIFLSIYYGYAYHKESWKAVIKRFRELGKQ